MGRHCGDLAMSAAVAGGAEYAIVPEVAFDKERSCWQQIGELSGAGGKKHAIITICEHVTDVNALAKDIEAHDRPRNPRHHPGSHPAWRFSHARDRIMSSRMGACVLRRRATAGGPVAAASAFRATRWCTTTSSTASGT